MQIVTWISENIVIRTVETTFNFGQTDMIIRFISVAKLPKPNIHSETGGLNNGVECHSLYRDFFYGKLRKQLTFGNGTTGFRANKPVLASPNVGCFLRLRLWESFNRSGFHNILTDVLDFFSIPRCF